MSRQQTLGRPAATWVAPAGYQPAPRPSTGAAHRRPRPQRSHAVILLVIFALALMIFPSDEVIKAVGGGGFVAALVSYCIFLCWAAATMFGMHNPLQHRSPVRISLCFFWVASLLTYITMNQGALSPTQNLGAQRWLIQLLGVSGIILVASECLRSLSEIKVVLRALAWGGAFCGVVAALQYWFRDDITPYLRMLPGFSVNSAVGVVGIGTRGALNRVAGTATDPIELGVCAGMILPLAVYLAMHDTDRPAWQRFVPVFCVALAIPTSVSRSAILACGIALGVLIVSLPPERRLNAIAGIIVAVAGVFVAAHGLIGTLDRFFFAGTSDASVAHRVDNYPYAEALIRHAPWFGQGGGTYSAGAGAVNLAQAHIFDDQYLTTAVELGLFGLVALIFFLIWPAVAAFTTRFRTTDPEIRDLCAALLGAELAATVCSFTFDSLGFPMFVYVQALVAGLIGAVYLLVGQQQPAAAGSRRLVSRLAVTQRKPVGVGTAEGGGGN
jgi:O-Antigen ligase